MDGTGLSTKAMMGKLITVLYAKQMGPQNIGNKSKLSSDSFFFYAKNQKNYCIYSALDI